MVAGDTFWSVLRGKPLLQTLQRASANALRRVAAGHNRLRGSEIYRPPTDLRAFQEVQAHSDKPTDISDHLERLFVEALQARPSTIVELGVRGGESTFAFERVARLAGADLVSVDAEEPTYATDYEHWWFVESDDLAFAEGFEKWCEENSVDPAIDVLFVDTSHRYEHTVAEIDRWFPHLADDAVVLFHDTNMGHVFRRKDGTVGLSPNRGRDVVRALEGYFDSSFKETESFVTVSKGFVLEHYPFCSGLTVLRRVDRDVDDSLS